MIHILDPLTANGIAAGEVVERPASVVKELIENSLDAGASIIHCQIEQGGIKKISISDNGSGMTEKDAKLAFQRHATSKLKEIKDLDSLLTMGFRGEALASIAAVAKVRLRTRQIGAEDGYEVIVEGGKIIKSGQVGCPEGTQIEVRDLFYNVPARYKFLKRDTTEQGYIADLITRLSLARADVSFRLTAKEKTLIHTPGNNDLLSVIYVLYGRETAEAMVEVDYQLDPIQVSGYITTPQVTRGNRSRQIVFVNGRNITSKVVSAAINEACKTWFMKGKFPSLIINLAIPLHLVDVNVHPQKIEVRFWNEQTVFRAIYHALREAFEISSAVIKGTIESKKNNTIEALNLKEKPTASKWALNENIQKKADSDARKQIAIESNNKDKISSQYTYKSMTEKENFEAEKVSNDFTERIQPREQAKAFLTTHQQEQNENSLINDEKSSKEDQNHSELSYLLEARLIGQVFQTYLLLEYQNKFILIDQHAAHERILYEGLHNKHLENRKKPYPKQLLLEPVQLELTSYEVSLIDENRKEIDHLGFEVDLFGDTTVLIRTVPDTKKASIDPKAAVQVLVDSLVDDSFFHEDKKDELLYTIACKAAVKAHDNLSYNEMKQIIQDLLTLNNPFHCPHGRPLMVNLMRSDLDKLFKRIV
ncbi:MAG TPA: DNA mismatch repair endonuclease MutL [Candidatus Eisenbacteria bacterium]|nr:DNA mismatch repair endonuclease MutL [Candidatus Eisenbacteria bacterium]